MKTLNKIVFFSALIVLTFACKNAPEGEAAKTGEAAGKAAEAPATAKTFKMTKGTINWSATKVGGQHMGTINASNGMLTVTDGNITSGSFDIDINSINVTDLEGEYKGKLEGHLKSGDFFEIEKFPTGKFVITNVQAASGNPDATHQITGDLTLKGISKSVVIPAHVSIMGDKVTAVTPKFTINRTEWDIKYGSGIIGTAKDEIIHDMISLSINMEAAAQ